MYDPTDATETRFQYMKRRGTWMLKQLLPLHYCTDYTTGGENCDKYADFVTWRMWFGKVFAYDRTRYEIARA